MPKEEDYKVKVKNLYDILQFKVEDLSRSNPDVTIHLKYSPKLQTSRIYSIMHEKLGDIGWIMYGGFHEKKSNYEFTFRLNTEGEDRDIRQRIGVIKLNYEVIIGLTDKVNENTFKRQIEKKSKIEQFRY